MGRASKVSKKDALAAVRWMIDDSRYFPSGSNHPGEIWGLGLVGKNVGVAAPEVAAAGEAALLEFGALGGGDVELVEMDQAGVSA